MDSMKKRQTEYKKSFSPSFRSVNSPELGLSCSKGPVPDVVFFILVLISLALPNIIFSGMFWFQTLHLMKWFVAMVPIGILALFLGFRLLRSGASDIGFRIDIFGWIWLFLLLYITLQPLWVDIRSVPTFVREWFFFATLWITYILCYNFFRGKYLRPILWLANINAALNVIFAELQITSLNSPFPFILPTPGNYIGNTGQQNMLGFWLAICALNSIFLHVAYRSEKDSNTFPGKLLKYCNLFILALLGWGIWNSTSRSAILSLLCGILFFLILIVRDMKKEHLRRLALVVLIFVIALSSAMVFSQQRVGKMISKTFDIVKNPEKIANRDSIWLSSWFMFTSQPMKGVGLGQYKWHYLDGQREMLKKHPQMDWKFTYWAHNEYLQWFCEAGLIPGIILMGMALWWLWSLFRWVILKKEISLEAVWGISMLGLIWFNAIWTRPFHRIEDALWMSFAFALANRDILPLESSWTKVRRGYLYRALGALILFCSIVGFGYLFHGMQGDVFLRKGVQTKHPFTQRTYLERAYDHLLVRDIAERQLAYHYLSIGAASKNTDYTVEGVERLYRYFLREPHSRELKTLMDWGVRLQNVELTREIASYLKPGSYNLQLRKN